jgi:hypothetical protein
MVKRGEFVELLVADAQPNEISVWLNRSPVSRLNLEKSWRNSEGDEVHSTQVLELIGALPGGLPLFSP